MINFDYQIQPFRVWVKIVFAESVAEGLQWLINDCSAKIGFDPETEKDTLGIVGHGLDANGLQSWYIVFNKNEFKLGILVHECLHAITRIADQKGLILSKDSDEYYAYAIEDMFNYIYNEYNKTM